MSEDAATPDEIPINPELHARGETLLAELRAFGYEVKVAGLFHEECDLRTVERELVSTLKKWRRTYRK